MSLGLFHYGSAVVVSYGRIGFGGLSSGRVGSGEFCYVKAVKVRSVSVGSGAFRCVKVCYGSCGQVW